MHVTACQDFATPMCESIEPPTQHFVTWMCQGLIIPASKNYSSETGQVPFIIVYLSVCCLKQGSP